MKTAFRAMLAAVAVLGVAWCVGEVMLTLAPIMEQLRPVIVPLPPLKL